jgi:flagellar protein FliS
VAVNNAYAQYNKNKVLTASPAELVLLLYEGAIKFCNIAIMGVEENNIEKIHTNLKKAQAIIEELQSTLNHSYKVAEDFDRMYQYIYSLLVDANIKKTQESIEKALVQIRGMRDTWKEVMRLTKNS